MSILKKIKFSSSFIAHVIFDNWASKFDGSPRIEDNQRLIQSSIATP